MCNYFLLGKPLHSFQGEASWNLVMGLQFLCLVIIRNVIDRTKIGFENVSYQSTFLKMLKMLSALMVEEDEKQLYSNLILSLKGVMFHSMWTETHVVKKSYKGIWCTFSKFSNSTDLLYHVVWLVCNWVWEDQHFLVRGTFTDNYLNL